MLRYCLTLNISETVRDTDSFNRILIETYYSTDSFRMTLSDSKIFSDMKRRAVSLRQLSFLYNIDFDRVVMQTAVKF